MISDWDKENIDAIMNGEGDWFAAELLRLIQKADAWNRERIRISFPEEVEAYEEWFNRG